MKALLLAAGEGTRLRPLTLDRPKPMLPVGGRPLLEHLVLLLRQHDVRDIAINLHYRPSVIVDHFGDGSRFGVNITYSYEPSLLGSAGAAKALESFFGDEDFFVVYGDVLTDMDLSELAAIHRRGGALVSMAVHEAEDPSRVGVVEIDSDSRVIGFVEKPAPGTERSNLANAGVYALSPDVLDLVPPAQPYDFGHDVFPLLLQRGERILAVRSASYVLDIGSPARYAQAALDLQLGHYAIATDPVAELLSTANGGRS